MAQDLDRLLARGRGDLAEATILARAGPSRGAAATHRLESGTELLERGQPRDTTRDRETDGHEQQQRERAAGGAEQFVDRRRDQQPQQPAGRKRQGRSRSGYSRAASMAQQPTSSSTKPTQRSQAKRFSSAGSSVGS